MKGKSLSYLAFAVLAFAVLTLIVRESFVGGGPVSLSAQVLALLLVVWARLTLGLRSFHVSAEPTPGGLVTSGPYRYVRHPIYAAALLFLWSGVLSHLSWVNLLLVLLATAAAGVRLTAEERLLTERYPEYGDYAARTKRMIPWLF